MTIGNLILCILGMIIGIISVINGHEIYKKSLSKMEHEMGASIKSFGLILILMIITYIILLYHPELTESLNDFYLKLTEGLNDFLNTKIG